MPVRSSLPPNVPFATVKAYRRRGSAAVTVERQDRPPRRYRVSLSRYHALREWLACSGHPWVTSGAYATSSIAVSLWAKHPKRLFHERPEPDWR